MQRIPLCILCLKTSFVHTTLCRNLKIFKSVTFCCLEHAVKWFQFSNTKSILELESISDNGLMVVGNVFQPFWEVLFTNEGETMVMFQSQMVSYSYRII